MENRKEKINFTLRLKPETNALVKKEAERLGISQSAVINTILSEEFEHRKSSKQ